MITKGMANLGGSAQMLKEMNASTSTKDGEGKNIGSVLNELSSGNKTGEATSSKVKNKGELNKEDFMTLLVAELRNQNPLEPMKNQEMGSQLAQFSQLEQLEHMNKGIKAMAKSNQPIERLYSSSLIGKTVVTESVKVDHEKGKTEGLSFNVSAQPSKVEIRIKDASDREIRKITADEELSEGINYVKWDGRADDGRYVDDGKYSYEVLAFDDHGSSMTVERGITGRVTAVDFSGEDVSLTLEGGKKINLAEIKNVTEQVASIKAPEVKIPTKDILAKYQQIAGSTIAQPQQIVQTQAVDEQLPAEIVPVNEVNEVNIDTQNEEGL